MVARSRKAPTARQMDEVANVYLQVYVQTMIYLCDAERSRSSTKQQPRLDGPLES